MARDDYAPGSYAAAGDERVVSAKDAVLGQSKCKACSARIVWARDWSGRNIPHEAASAKPCAGGWTMKRHSCRAKE